METVRHRILLGVFWIALMASLVWALLPHPPPTGLANDKFQHVVAFTTLSLLMSLTFEQWSRARQFLTLAGLGGAIEVLQLIPELDRDAEWADWLADCAASAVVLAVHGCIGTISRRRTRGGLLD